jgi:hypothetical protein
LSLKLRILVGPLPLDNIQVGIAQHGTRLIPHSVVKTIPDTWRAIVVEAATPGSGSYVTEAEFRQPDIQTTLWGGNYNKLLRIKKKWDPSDLFYATVSVGSDVWNVQNDGRMCRAA